MSNDRVPTMKPAFFLLSTAACLFLTIAAAPAADPWPFPTKGAPSATGGREGEGDFEIGPDYTEAPELKRRDNVPRGAVNEFTMSSADSKIYPGVKGPYTRKCAVYIPQQYRQGKPAPFIVVQDGMGYVKRLTTALDNLIADKKVPPMVAIFVDSGGGDGKGSERGLEYDTVSDVYTNFVETEVLPRVTKDYKVSLTKYPEGRATMGCSSGAACAFTMAWFRPDLYRRVLSYSGTYVDQQSPEDPKLPDGAWSYHKELIPKSPAKPIRIWMHVSENDNRANDPESTLHNWVMANQRMAAALKAKGYHYRYVFSKASGHCDGRVVAQTLPEALVWLWQGYAAK
jgi:enterochelin esterase-like enzyme